MTRTVLDMEVEGVRGKPKQRYMDTMRRDIKKNGLMDVNILDHPGRLTDVEKPPKSVRTNDQLKGNERKNKLATTYLAIQRFVLTLNDWMMSRALLAISYCRMWMFAQPSQSSLPFSSFPLYVRPTRMQQPSCNITQKYNRPNLE